MGFWSSILPIVGALAGSVLLPGIGTAIGGALGGAGQGLADGEGFGGIAKDAAFGGLSGGLPGGAAANAGVDALGGKTLELAGQQLGKTAAPGIFAGLGSKILPTIAQAGLGYALGGPQGALQFPLMAQAGGFQKPAVPGGADPAQHDPLSLLGGQGMLPIILGALGGRALGGTPGGMMGMGAGGLMAQGPMAQHQPMAPVPTAPSFFAPLYGPRQ